MMLGLGDLEEIPSKSAAFLKGLFSSELAPIIALSLIETPCNSSTKPGA